MLFGPKARSEAKKMIILLTDGATTKADREVLEYAFLVLAIFCIENSWF